jgi:hypothetical protein
MCTLGSSVYSSYYTLITGFCQCEFAVVSRWKNSQDLFQTVGFLPRFDAVWGTIARFFYRLDKMESLVLRGYSQMLHRSFSQFSRFSTPDHSLSGVPRWRPPCPLRPLQRGIHTCTLLSIVGISNGLQRGIWVYAVSVQVLSAGSLQRGI